MQTRQLKRGGSVVLAIISGNEILLIRQPNKLYPNWKMQGETMKPDESLAHAVKRAAMEEAGLEIPLPKEAGGKVVLQNSKMTVGEINCMHYRKYTQYFYAIILKYPSKLHSLGGKTFLENKKETIRTKVFNIRQVAELPDFLPQQRPLLDILLQTLPQTA